MRQSHPGWTWIVPLAALAVLGAAFIAHKVGEPFGTLVLAVAVTVIEVALIVSLMMAAGPEKAGLARERVLSAITSRASGSRARAPRWRCSVCFR
jgi:Ca2+:H+ antiporter